MHNRALVYTYKQVFSTFLLVIFTSYTSWYKSGIAEIWYKNLIVTQKYYEVHVTDSVDTILE